MLMRIAFLLLFLIGAAVGLVYPWAIRNLAGHEIGTWRVYEAGSGFRAIDARLGSTDAPVKAFLDMSAAMPTGALPGGRVLTVTASTQGRTVLAETVDLSAAERREEAPQALHQLWRLPAGTLPAIEDGDYSFVVGPGDAEGIDIRSVDLLLLGGGGAYDERAQPVGFSIMAIGFIGFVLSFRRRGKDGGQPPAPRWGRGGT
ncbi:hypothetical protein [Kumtagia ephedrae]|nr:hypothetical protein [Mesorhizobium ephedrae]